MNWVPLIIFFSIKCKIEHDEARSCLKCYLLNFKFLLHFHTSADILEWMSIAALSLQSDIGGKSIGEAASVIQERLKFITLQAMPGNLEKKAAK